MSKGWGKEFTKMNINQEETNQSDMPSIIKSICDKTEKYKFSFAKSLGRRKSINVTSFQVYISLSP